MQLVAGAEMNNRLKTTGQLSLFECKHSFYLNGDTEDEEWNKAYKWTCSYCNKTVVNIGWLPYNVKNIDNLPSSYKKFFKIPKKERR